MVNNPEFLGLLEQRLGVYRVLFGWHMKPHTPNKVHVLFMNQPKQRSTLAKNLLADESSTTDCKSQVFSCQKMKFYSSHYSGHYIWLCTLVRATHTVARLSNYSNFCWALGRPNFSSGCLHRHLLFYRRQSCCCQLFKGWIQLWEDKRTH